MDSRGSLMSPATDPKRAGANEWSAVAAAELRTLRRLVRTWVFVALAVGLLGSAFLYHSYWHSLPGGISRIALLPRFMWSGIDYYALWLIMAAVVFLAFDSRHRDEQSCIREALEARPVSNLALSGGRLCAVAVATLAVLWGASILIQVTGALGGAFGWTLHPIEPVSMFTFLLVDAVAALVTWCAVVLLLDALMGNRLAVAVTALALLGLHMWFRTPDPGANVVESLARHLTTFQTHAIGPGASALDEVVEELAATLPDDGGIPFSVDHGTQYQDVEDEIGASLIPVVRFVTASTRSDFPGFSAIIGDPGAPETWARLLGASLADLDMQNRRRDGNRRCDPVGALGLSRPSRLDRDALVCRLSNS